MKNSYTVYLFQNLINNKIYIGYTKDFKNRWKQHLDDAEHGSSLHFHRAIKLYGKNSFVYEFLKEGLTLEEAKRFETLWILTFGAYDSLVGYNMTFGGDGVNWEILPDSVKSEACKKRSKKMLGRSLENRWGKEKALAHIEKLRRLFKGKTIEEIQGLDKEEGKLFRKRLTAAHFGKDHTNKGIRSAAHKFFKGKTYEEIGRNPSPLRSYMWITNGIESTLVPSNLPIPNGYKKGRVFRSGYTPFQKISGRLKGENLSCQKQS